MLRVILCSILVVWLGIEVFYNYPRYKMLPDQRLKDIFFKCLREGLAELCMKLVVYIFVVLFLVLYVGFLLIKTVIQKTLALLTKKPKR